MVVNLGFLKNLIPLRFHFQASLLKGFLGFKAFWYFLNPSFDSGYTLREGFNSTLIPGFWPRLNSQRVVSLKFKGL